MRKKKSNKKIEPKEKQSRAVYQRPTKVKELIEFLNSVPMQLRLPDLEELGNEFEDFLLTLPKKFVDQIKLKALSVVNKVFSPQHEDYEKAILSNQKWEYQIFLNTRQDVRELVNSITLARNNELSINEGVQLPPLISQVKREISENGIYNAQLSGLDEVLNGVYLDRLRFCEVCSHIFWAENKNSFTCSETCRNALRQRKYRKKNKEDVNAKRRERYQQEKHKKELEKEKRRKALFDQYKKE